MMKRVTMIKQTNPMLTLGRALELPCGVTFNNRLAKSPMSDSLANGEGDATQAQIRLYERWAQGGAAVSFIGEVQGDPRFPERPGNLVLTEKTNTAMISELVKRATINGAQLWPQLGHAGALSYLPISQPQGPSALAIEGLQCARMQVEDIQALPHMYAKAALHAKAAGFGGVHIHAGHGFLLSQFLSPLFNHRTDAYGGSIEARCHIVLDVISAVRCAVGARFPVGIRINATDMLEGGLSNSDALEVVRLLDRTTIDLIDISGGTYFPGAKASSDSSSQAPYFINFAHQAKALTTVPVLITGGFKARDQAVDAIASGAADMVGLARAMVLNPNIANDWLSEKGGDPTFPTFDSNPQGGITAWYTMRLTALAEDREQQFDLDLPTAMRMYEERDAQRCLKWREKFAYLQLRC